MSHSSGSLSPPPFQFSLRWLLIVMTVAAVLLGLLAGPARDFFYIIAFGAIFYAVPTAFITMVLFGHGEYRTFAIGVLVPWVLVWLRVPAGFPAALAVGGPLGSALYFLLFGGVCGMVAVATRRWLERRNPD